MIDHIVVDVEIQKTIEETPGGWDATDKLGVAVACVWEYRTQRMRVYGPEDLHTLQGRLFKADKVSGFNIWKFDYPCIWGFSSSQWQAESQFSQSVAETKNALRKKTNDLLRRIWQALLLDPDRFDKRTHGGWGLDSIASATLGAGKIGHGAEAPKWYQAGQVQRVVNYCADDVALERDLTDFIERYGFVLNNIEGRETVLRIPRWEGEQ